MKVLKYFLFLLVLPLTLVLDFILFNLIRVCPSCGSFSQFIASEGALSFPFVVIIMEWFEQLIPQKKRRI